MVESSDSSGGNEPNRSLLLAALQVAEQATALVDAGRVVFANDALLSLIAHPEPSKSRDNFTTRVAPLIEEARRSPGAAFHGRFAFQRSDGPLHLDLSILPLSVTGQEWHAVFARPARDFEKGEPQRFASERLLSLGRMAAAVAHDFNNPLAYVLGSIELAEQHVRTSQVTPFGNDRYSDILETIANAREGVERLRRIVKNLMVFSRPTAEADSLIDIERLLDSTIKLVWNEIRHRARLVKRYGRVGHVLGDESRLGQVFFNLLINAAQSFDAVASADAEIVIATSEEGGLVIVEVIDSGAGIREQDLPHIFEPSFFIKKPSDDGIELGLSVCRAIVCAHNGEIAVKSRQGHGATFRVTLPLAHHTIGSASPPQCPGEVEFRARILVIDDEPLLGQTLGFAFSGRHDVVVTTSGREALALLAAGDARFDLVLCDLMMPDVTGQNVFETVEKEHPELVEQFVFMTGGAFTDSAHDFLERHPGRRIEKPFTMSEIERLISGTRRGPHA